MAKYRKIDPRIWNDAKFRALSDPAKLVFFMLLSHPNMTSLGAMRATLSGLAEELAWEPEAFRGAFAEVLSKGMAEHDKKACLVALPNFLKYNPPESPNVVKAWVSAIDLLPECGLKIRVIAGAGDFAKGLSQGFGEALPEVFAKAMPIQEQEQEQEQELNVSASLPGVAKHSPRLTCPHEHIKALYAELCHELPAVKVWSSKRQNTLRARWTEMSKAKGWRTEAEGLAWFRNFFKEAVANDFITGRSERGAGHEGWRADFDFLISMKGFTGVIEGRYTNRGAA